MGLVVCLILFTLTHIHAADLDEETYLRDQREALIAFKGKITGDPKRELQGWNNHSRPCTWAHIACDSDEGNDDYVTGIELAGCNLSGELAPELGMLTKLRFIFLNDNNISGEIPPELLHMASLVVLEIESNRVSGSLPGSLDKLSSVIAMCVFKLRNNKLNGSLPASLFHMKSLQYIDLSNNELSGNADDVFLPGFFENSNLVHVDLRGNKDLTGVCSDEVCKEKKKGQLSNYAIKVSVFRKFSFLSYAR